MHCALAPVVCVFKNNHFVKLSTKSRGYRSGLTIKQGQIYEHHDACSLGHADCRKSRPCCIWEKIRTPKIAATDYQAAGNLLQKIRPCITPAGVSNRCHASEQRAAFPELHRAPRSSHTLKASHAD
jgi:hypothetical protein